ncbi:MAG: betaine/proline/choline family ABC transporter ATP-binding protein [Oceanospirillaceae bacterium]|jgi:glycine betaine/proline transport system ATP-binding protein|nr:betaine/proline/choline family ABC transporter ATP-binding protein [Oceanospirillaceae bacterium]MBT4442531.1 betaine/proline/choline family ABC transporter ATP-binding protein [Oceanospirillaceae bacterium]MBT6077658.1 betaine/proline/choline family ABC transporter ATP-binding protein [Oceanospirillaceae bacterium]
MTPSAVNTPPATVVEVSNVWKIFGDNAEAALKAIREKGLSKAQVLTQYNAVVGVADVSFNIKKGEIFCIMGLSGSGKSTLVRHFNRLLEPTAGSIRIQGTDVMALEAKQLQEFRNRQIGMVFQNFALMPHRSVLDNVAMPLEIRKINKNERLEKAAEILNIVDLSAWGNKFAHELSGGMQQRVGLARALAADPDVLLMDEPFSALDPLIRRQLQDEFIELSASLNKTTIFITHDLDEAVRIGDRIAIMRDGEVVQIGTAEDIVLRPVDDYVAEFVAGISHLKVIRASALAQPIEAYTAAQGPIVANAPRIDDEMPLNKVMQLAIDHDQIVVTHNAVEIGVINRQLILQAVLDGGEL